MTDWNRKRLCDIAASVKDRESDISLSETQRKHLGEVYLLASQRAKNPQAVSRETFQGVKSKLCDVCRNTLHCNCEELGSGYLRCIFSDAPQFIGNSAG